LYYKKESIIFIEYKQKLYMLVLPYEKYSEYKKFIKEILFVK
jgi:hypothetical protein